ncbi:probable poly(ADP-ribose) glycohydrolase 2 [Triticum dicoccoides]|uniref:probable poly(ADP-ribose) glycohydrolase 2 n=1 Tax=Triticum dicoccoides TaxID=85692 RepID=UPI00188F227D|nr:probable poly(ADP-ribose) glycohydrolase 2 [Triticum dicoccoides]
MRGAGFVPSAALYPDTDAWMKAHSGYAYFKLCSLFADMLPCLARLLLRLPTLLEDHYTSAWAALGLCLLGSQGVGIVLIGQLLAPVLFCVFPTAGHGFYQQGTDQQCEVPVLCRLTVMLG